MRSTARIGSHPMHPMLILVPAGAFMLVLVLDVVYVVTGQTMWWAATFPVIIVGVAGALLAAVPGTIDLFTIVREHEAMSLGLLHMVFNLLMVALFTWNGFLRWDASPPQPGVYFEMLLSIVGNVLLLVSGWLGGEMVYGHHVGVIEPEKERARQEERRPHAMTR